MTTPRFAMIPLHAGCFMLRRGRGIYVFRKPPPRYQWALELLANVFGYEAVRLGVGMDYEQTHVAGVVVEIDGKKYGAEFPLRLCRDYWPPTGGFYPAGFDATDMPAEFVDAVLRLKTQLLEIDAKWKPAPPRRWANDGPHGQKEPNQQGEPWD